MPLKTGTWKINSNGTVGELYISAVEGGGNVTGRVLIDAPRLDDIEGFWNELTQELIFQRIMKPGDPTALQIYRGFLFEDPLRVSGVGGSIAYTLSGYFDAFTGAGGFPQRYQYGWYAQIGLSLG